MSNDKNFVDGLIVKRNDRAPDFVICNLSIKVEELKGWLDRNDDGSGWINVKVNRSQGGKLYAEKDDWKPQQQGQAPMQQTPMQPQAPMQPSNAPYEAQGISQPPNFPDPDGLDDSCPF